MSLMVEESQLASHAAAYAEHGYVLVKGLLDKAEARAYREESHALIERLNRDADPTWESARHLGMGERTELKHCHDVQFQAAAFSRLLVDPRFTDVAAAVMGTPNVQLHHTKLFVKPPEKGSPFPMHQDHPFFPHAKHSVGAAIFHFDDAPLEKGCVQVMPGSHRGGPLTHRSEGGWHLPYSEWPLENATPCEAEAGDVLFFTYLTVHGSGVNTTPEARTTLLVQYRDPADPPTEDLHTHSLGQGMILRGVDPTSRGAAAAAM
ncbi:Ectoine hydroxylase-related dioxygenase, phytanoyl-CoA dioxygenase (PhyH) family [Actinopolymorpha cephalotaxi]|uniref:Ectoine hydroxylase-related dioxygenase (Phytanoyl-CoA dioxygenase family) n=1 Tax=Actinopolymorpha cephalotaxi TaxID=504797 RepID=A0A1I2USK7_9ACTN|nr:phytanoyl-CoA dioxygenase family protein [Actinopolymorpha cephalotaxi]NYH86637.1 ectoine hydroxylase-related dioxygenase (phytanoyl-CoA dioxygenase family) [Actinopolymorpha cephalotaxi]SFG77721.1 Ectoine hydroxylase-related dioxygenase, phytanoyl-CoA dioxygenase (PhyH) family [Actinopolymorpha cephalotaxi]